jgi:PAS domain S-box-containing protein
MEPKAGDLTKEIAALGRKVQSVQQLLDQRLSHVLEESVSERLRLELILDSARLAWWDQDFVGGKVERSPSWALMLDYQPGEIPPTLEAWHSLLHPEDAPAVKESARLHEEGNTSAFCAEHRMRARGGDWRWILNWGRITHRAPDGTPLRAVGTHLDITERKRAELEKEFLISRLQRVVSRIRPLRGIIPICSGCRRVRSAEEQWVPLDAFIRLHSEAEFSHGICPVCAERIYPDFCKSP